MSNSTGAPSWFCVTLAPRQYLSQRQILYNPREVALWINVKHFANGLDGLVDEMASRAEQLLSPKPDSLALGAEPLRHILIAEVRKRS